MENATTVETVVYDYNLQGRLKQVTVSRTGEDDFVTEYQYDVDGNRVEKSVTVGAATAVVTKYLIDPSNHTGYAQTLIESDGTNTTVYTVGDDVLAQAKGGVTKWLLYDGQGSTRQLVNAANSVDDSYSYDAYGVLLQEDTTALRTRPGYVDQASIATNLLYAGEHFDTDTQQYYNRARWYDPLNGRFDRVDPYAGNMSDPQSLHKYLYCHANPVNGVDPSGMFGEFSLPGLAISMSIGAVIGGIVGGVITQSWKGVVYGALIGAAIGAAIYTIIAFWPQIVQWFKTLIQKVIEVQKADRTVSNRLFARINKFFGGNATQAQKIRYLSKIKWYKLVGEGFVGYGQKIWQLLTLNFTGLGTWFTPTLFDGIVGGAVVAVVVLIYIYKDDIKQLFTDLEQPMDPNIIKN